MTQEKTPEFWEYARARREQILRRTPQSEDQLQKDCFEMWNEWYAHLCPEAIFHHSPNGGSRHPAEAAKLKRMGVLAGWPDVTLIIPGAELTFIELKTAKGTLRTAQKELHDRLREWGAEVHVVRSVAGFVWTLDLLIPLPYGD